MVGMRFGVCSSRRGVWGKYVLERCFEAQVGVWCRYGLCDSLLCEGESSSGVGGLWRLNVYGAWLKKEGRLN